MNEETNCTFWACLCDGSQRCRCSHGDGWRAGGPEERLRVHCQWPADRGRRDILHQNAFRRRFSGTLRTCAEQHVMETSAGWLPERGPHAMEPERRPVAIWLMPRSGICNIVPRVRNEIRISFRFHRDMIKSMLAMRFEDLMLARTSPTNHGSLQPATCRRSGRGIEQATCLQRLIPCIGEPLSKLPVLASDN